MIICMFILKNILNFINFINKILENMVNNIILLDIDNDIESQMIINKKTV